MNEFEKLLGTIEPATGKSSPMQIMYRAGQQSAQTGLLEPTVNATQKRRSATSGAVVFWKIATGVMTAACLLLTVNLFQLDKGDQKMAAETSNSETQSALSDDHDSKLAVVKDDGQNDIEKKEQTYFVVAKPAKKPPLGLSRLGPHARQSRPFSDRLLSDGRSEAVAPMTTNPFRPTPLIYRRFQRKTVPVNL